MTVEAELLSDRLVERMPLSGTPAIVHNDFKIDNCQFAPGEPDRVVSVFDWDMATIGDPLVDVGTLLNYWPDPSDGDDGALAVPGLEKLGLPTRAEVVDRYRADLRARADGHRLVRGLRLLEDDRDPAAALRQVPPWGDDRRANGPAR